MPIRKGEIQLLFVDFLFIVENTAHIPLILRGSFKPNHWLFKALLPTFVVRRPVDRSLPDILR